jgi:hypothetical protein
MKFKDYRQFYGILEGLITTYPMDFFYKKLLRLFSGKNLNVSIKIDKLTNSLILNLKTDSIDSLSILDKIADSNGYFISLIETDNGIWTKLSEITLTTLTNLSIHFESKFDEEVEVKDIPEFLYHVTPSKYVEKIKKIGLIPKAKNRQSFHMDRIYFALTIEGVNSIEKEFEFNKQPTNYTILKISTKNLKVKFIKDPNATLLNGEALGIYTYENISPSFII